MSDEVRKKSKGDIALNFHKLNDGRTFDSHLTIGGGMTMPRGWATSWRETVSDMELYPIRELKDREDRLNPDMKESALCGLLLLFYGMYDERHKERLLGENDYSQLYEKAKAMKRVSQAAR